MATEATTDMSALAAAKRKEFTRSMIELAGMLPVLIVICILFAALTPNFLTQNNIVNVVRQASINIVLAAGMTFVILTGGIDLAVGSVLGFTAVIAVVVSLIPAIGWAAVPLALLAGLVVGVLTGRQDDPTPIHSPRRAAWIVSRSGKSNRGSLLCSE
jgi:ribose transport system permease protein